MANYVQVINNNGTVTIDDTTARLVKTRTITFSDDDVPAYVPSGDLYYIRGYISDQYILGGYATKHITLQSNEKIVAVRALNKHENVSVLGGFVSPTVYMIVLQSSFANTNLYMSDYRFDVYGTVPSTELASLGFEVFNESGVKIFDSNYYYMDVSSTFSVVNDSIVAYTEQPNTYDIGSYDRSKCGVALSSCLNILHVYPRYRSPAGSTQYGVVFGDGIKLERRVNPYIQFVYSGGTWTPQSYSSLGSGIILNTENIA